ncbi:MAG: DNA polymerase III subunit alpha, partial [Lachnospiraceae bacterium]|nr:DNA polymerase III subunit alpha [Lachnospiraceae bacterium]
DPIKYNLLFERFLNPERVSMPDIDIDFSDERRGEVIDYVVDKYGEDCVTQIVTFGTLAARNVIRDVGRVLDLPYAYVDKIAKSIPKELKITIKGALEKNPELLRMYEEDDTVKRLLDLAMRLEGLPRNTSIHAAGVVISQKPMVEYIPLARAQDGTITTQFIMTTIEELGLLKMDFLGLRTLSVIDNAIHMIEKNDDVKIDYNKLGYDDKKVFELIGSGKTEGVFQLESAGMKNFMKELRPENLEDVIAGISLYRPGPMDFIPDYIKGKNDKASITYLTPQLEPILEPTYGCIVYQEQVMQIVRDLAGYSMGRSDLVRRAMSKKKDEVMEKERANFVYGNQEEGVKGCVNNGIDEDVANVIYDKMLDFAKYAFNKSHAAAYAVVAYQTAYLKCYYPVEFMASLMSSVIINTTKVSEYIYNCKSMGIEVLPPSVNYGEGRFAVDNGKIRYGMYAIKSVGTNIIDRIVNERKANGPYTTIENFISRTNGFDVNKRAIENLIKAGALDGLDANRRQMLSIYTRILDNLNADKKKSIEGQMSLFDMADDSEKSQYEIKLPPYDEYDKETLLEFEKEALNIYVSGHPLEGYKDVMDANITNVTTDLMLDETTGECKVSDNSYITVGGLIVDKTVKYTKNNQPMAFITIEDLAGQAEVIVFPDMYSLYKDLLDDDSKVLIYGKVNASDDQDAKIICEGMKAFKDVNNVMWVIFDTVEDYKDNEEQLHNIVKKQEGDDRVWVFIKKDHLTKGLGNEFNTLADDKMIDLVKQNFGDKNVRIQREKVKFNKIMYKK